MKDAGVELLLDGKPGIEKHPHHAVVAGKDVSLEAPKPVTPRNLSQDLEHARGDTASLKRIAGDERDLGMFGPLRVGLSPGRRIFTAGRVRWSVVNLRDDGDNDDHASACADTNLIFERTTRAGSLTRSIELPDFSVDPANDRFFRR